MSDSGANYLIDQIYEAAFVPEQWDGVLLEIGNLLGAPSGTLFVFDDIKPVRFQATQLVHELARNFVAGDKWQESERIQFFRENPIAGFVIAEDYYPAGFLERDKVFLERRRMGLGAQTGTIIPMPSGELVALIFEKWKHDGPFAKRDIRKLNLLYGHLARAGLISARLGLERAKATVSALDAIGLPAAVMSRRGRVLTANDLLDQMGSLFVTLAHGGMALADPEANGLFQQAVTAAQDGDEPLVRSIPVAGNEVRAPTVVHVLPLRGAAHDIFSGADLLIAATAVDTGTQVPSQQLLSGLFDLSPAEARLAAALAVGRSLKQFSVESGLQFSTVRTYLQRIFRKTGTNQQSQLVSLLNSAAPITPRSRDLKRRPSTPR